MTTTNMILMVIVHFTLYILHCTSYSLHRNTVTSVVDLV